MNINLYFRLQKANRHLDEASAKLLIERALIIDEQGEYKFSRDLYVKLTVNKLIHTLFLILKVHVYLLTDVFKRSLYRCGRNEIRYR